PRAGKRSQDDAWAPSRAGKRSPDDEWAPSRAGKRSHDDARALPRAGKSRRDDFGFDRAPRKLSGFGGRGFTGNARTDLGKPGKSRRKDGFGHSKR
ncbi:MAG: hypothetical protein IJT83_01885, partial [Victivallales bacterium]|nr:hypothetical protein [Victivallales bacterium]